MGINPLNMDSKHIDAAGKALRVLRGMGTPRDAQVSLALMVVYLCQQNEVQVDDFIAALNFNLQGFGKDTNLLLRILNDIHKEVSPVSVVVPVRQVK